MDGAAAAPGAGTILNALATGTGSAFAIDVETRAEVCLESEGEIEGLIVNAPDSETALIERCVSLTIERYGSGQGGQVQTAGEIPIAGGLKSSSAAANATVLATLDALDITVEQSDGDTPSGESAVSVSRLEACRLGVEAARETGVTVTGAFDDASASMFGGVTVTDNDTDRLISQNSVEWDVLVWTPPERAYSADADVERCAAVAPVAEVIANLARQGEYGSAMTVNGLAFSAALGFSADPAVEAMPYTTGVSLSGTGPSVVAVGDRESFPPVRESWEDRPGTVRQTTTNTEGARILSGEHE